MMHKVILIGLLSLFTQFTDVASTGTGAEVDPAQNFCSGATGPRPITGVSSPGNTINSTVDADAIGHDYCGVDIDSPGIWWWVNGTGEVIRASSCDERTKIKVKLAVFTGNCGALRCVTGGALPDYECHEPKLVQKGANEAWGTFSTAVDFPTRLGQHYFILVQQATPNTAGIVWMNFRHPALPQNNECIDAIGPVPRDLTALEASTLDGAVSHVPDAGYCGAFPHYPGIWYQVFGTGKPLTVHACGQNNFDGFYINVYNGAYCHDMSCVSGTYAFPVTDVDRCSFGPAAVDRPLTKYTFDTRDRDRYFIYIHFAETRADRPTADFRFWIDDGENGKGGSGALTSIKFEEPSKSSGDGSGDDDGNGSGDGGGSAAVTRGLSMVGALVALGVSLVL